MRKMGWREGEGLGKNKEGNKEPILVDFKTDRKGNKCFGEGLSPSHSSFHSLSAFFDVCDPDLQALLLIRMFFLGGGVAGVGGGGESLTHFQQLI